MHKCAYEYAKNMHIIEQMMVGTKTLAPNKCNDISHDHFSLAVWEAVMNTPPKARGQREETSILKPQQISTLTMNAVKCKTLGEINYVDQVQ